MKFIFLFTLLATIFYTFFSIYLLYLESQKKTLIRKIIMAGIIGILFSMTPVFFGEIGIQNDLSIYIPIIIFTILIFISVIIGVSGSRKQNLISKEKTEILDKPEGKKSAGVVANWAESVLSIVEDRREKRERRGNDRRKDGSFIRLESGDPESLIYRAPTLEVSWHGVFSENISGILKQNLLIPKNIYTDFYIFIYQMKSDAILEFKIPKPFFSFLPVISLDFHDVQFDPGDKILICSKNLITNPNKDGERFGEEKIKSFLRENSRLNSKDFANSFAEDLQDWAEDLKKEGKAAFSAIEVI